MINQFGKKLAVISIFIVPAFSFNTHKPAQPIKQVAQESRSIDVHHKQLGGINTVVFKQCVLLTEYVECK
jgi:hypothetical protein